MGLDATASLVVAAMQLSVVRLLRDAIRTADLSSGKGLSATPLGPDPSPDIAPRRHLQPTVVYEPRVHVHPKVEEASATLRYDLVCGTPFREACLPPVSMDGLTVCAGGAAENPRPRMIPPVWATLPPIVHDPPVRRPIKVVRRVSDTRCKGLVIDLHI